MTGPDMQEGERNLYRNSTGILTQVRAWLLT